MLEIPMTTLNQNRKARGSPTLALFFKLFRDGIVTFRALSVPGKSFFTPIRQKQKAMFTQDWRKRMRIG
jgi:hypothetical protein